MPVKVTAGCAQGIEAKAFPKLMRHKETGNIYYLEEYGRGIRIKNATKNSPDISIWSGGLNAIPSEWEDYNEPVTLQNA